MPEHEHSHLARKLFHAPATSLTACTAELDRMHAHGHVLGLMPAPRQHIEGCADFLLRGSGSQVGRVGVQFVGVIRLGALEDDQQHNEHAGVDEVTDALHAEGQHHLHSTFHACIWSWLMHGWRRRQNALLQGALPVPTMDGQTKSLSGQTRQWLVAMSTTWCM